MLRAAKSAGALPNKLTPFSFVPVVLLFVPSVVLIGADAVVLWRFVFVS